MPFDFSKYAEKCQYAHLHGIENSFYTAFENMLDHIFCDQSQYRILNNPKSEKGEGHADFQVNRDDVPFLRIEAKPPKYDVEKWLAEPNCHADATRLSQQLHKYRRSVDMIILATDFKTIWWLDTQEMVEDETAPIPILYTFHILQQKLTPHPQLDDDFKRFVNLLYLDLDTARTNIMDLLDHIMPYVKRLRVELARIQESPHGKDELALQKHMNEILSDLKKTLFKDCQENLAQKFTDLYTQVVAYGIFMAWIRFNKGHRRAAVFSIDTVSFYLPSGSLMQNLFGGIKEHLSSDLIASVFTPMEKWFNKTEYGDIAVRIDDLMNEFYSGFLEKYDAETKKKMGVVYTPKDVVDFMVRVVEHFLTTAFKLSDGILDTSVKYLDPSAGTMAYPCSLMELAYRKICTFVDADPNSFHTDAEKRSKFSAWFREAYLRKDDRLSNVFGFEILMAPYVLGSLRVLMTAEKLGAQVDYSHDKVQMYLMNTLMDYPANQTIDDYLLHLENPHVKNELREGLKIRKKEDIMVLFTNPPYNVSSQNASQWITQLVNDYITPENLTREKGKPQVKNIRGLTCSKDDYWKFLRFAQWKIAENGKRHGIVAFITNNFYIDGLAARGLRKEYYKSFDEIWIVDLHGDWKKVIPDRAKITADENIFNVNCGIAIIFAIRYPSFEHSSHKKDDLYACEVHYHELWGSAISKLQYLSNHAIIDIPFTNVSAKLDWELTPFISEDVDYNKYPYLCDIFHKNIACIDTGHSDEVIDYDIESLQQKIAPMFDTYRKSENTKENAAKTWNPFKIHHTNATQSATRIDKIVWNGFDQRYVIYDHYLLARSRYQLMQYMYKQQNIALLSYRANRNGMDSCYFISRHLVESNALDRKDRCYLFPLKINDTNDKDDFYSTKDPLHSNLNPRFMINLPYWDWKTINEHEKLTASEAVFSYIYGILYTPTYRAQYHDMLTKDFPRIPFPESEEAFQSMSQLGKKVIDFHLLTDSKVGLFDRQHTNIDTLKTITYEIGHYEWIARDDPTIGDLWFNAKKKSVKNDDKTVTITYIPDTSSLQIQNVPKSVWLFEIGGVQQLDVWLYCRRYSATPKKDHLARGITQDELKYFLRVINAITDTIALLPQLNDAYAVIDEQILPITIPPEPSKSKSASMPDYDA